MKLRHAAHPAALPLSVLALLLTPVLLLTACDSDEELAGPGVSEPVPAIVDGGHGGTPGTYFLSPMVKGVDGSGGTLDGSLLPYLELQVCEMDGEACDRIVSSFTADGKGPERLRIEDGAFQANWRVGKSGADAGEPHRIRVLAGGTELAYADVVVVRNRGQARGIDEDEFVVVTQNQTLPIKVVVEEGAVGMLLPEGSAFTWGGGALAVDAPEGAVDRPVGVLVSEAEPEDHPSDPTLVDGSVLRLAPDTVDFAEPVSLTLAYDEANVSDTVPEFRLRLHQVTDGDAGTAWVEPSESAPDTDANTVTGTVDGLGTVGVLRRRAPARVEVVPEDTVITAFDDEATLRATAYAAGGWVIQDAAFEWALAGDGDEAIIDAPVAEGDFDASAVVLALANGDAGVVATTEGVEGSTGVTIRQVPDSLELTLANDSLEALDDTTTVSAVARDANGHEIVEDELVQLSWSSSDAGVATVAGVEVRSARATAVGNGDVDLVATDADGATGAATLTVEQVPFAAAAVHGDAQTGGTGESVPNPLVAEVMDFNLHPIADVAVTWDVVSGGGSATPLSSVTDAQGRTSATLVLGGAVELNEARMAVVADPAVAAIFTAVPRSPPVPTTGGVVEVLDGAVKLDIPAGALESETAISAVPVDPLTVGIELGDVAPGTLYDFGPDGLQFPSGEDDTGEVTEDELPPEATGDGTVPAEDSLSTEVGADELEEVAYPDHDLDTAVEVQIEEGDPADLGEPVLLTLRFDSLPEGMTEDDLDALVVAKWDPDTETWTEMPGSLVDEASRTVSAPIESFSWYGIRYRRSLTLLQRQLRPRTPWEPVSVEREGTPYRLSQFMVNGRVRWRVRRATRWGGPVRGWWNRLLILPHGPGSWTISARGRVCVPRFRARVLWMPGPRLIRLRPGSWTYLYRNGRIWTTQNFAGTTYYRIRIGSARYALCRRDAISHTFKVGAPPPASIALHIGGTRPGAGNTASVDRLNTPVRLFARPVDARGRFMPWVRLSFDEDGDVARVFNIKDTFRGWDTWIAESLANGTAGIRASAQGVESRIVEMTVEQVAAEVTISPEALVLSQSGDTATLSALVTDPGGAEIEEPGLTWASADEAVATVNASGLLTAVGGGATTVTAIAENGVESDVAEVEVGSPAAITVTPTSATLALLGETLTLTAVVVDASGNVRSGDPVTWTSSDASVATVDADGVVTSVADGIAEVRAAAGGVESDPVTVSVDAEKWAVNPDNGHTYVAVPVLEGIDHATASARAEAMTHEGRSGHLATITSAEENAFLVDSLSQSVSPSPGFDPAYGYWIGGERTGPDDLAATSWEWDTGEAFLYTNWLVDQTNAANQDYIHFWISSSEPAGRWNNVWSTIELPGFVVEFGPYPASVTVSQSSLTLPEPGATADLTATVLDQDGNVLSDEPVSWSSSDTDVATVDASGRVEGVAVGSATISVSPTSGTSSASVNVTVEGPEPAVSEISPPASVVEGALESSSHAFLFTERAGETLPTDLDVDATAPGQYTSNSLPGRSTISAGTAVNSHFIHMDHDGGASDPRSFSGEVTFDAEIVGVILSDGTLDASDGILGAEGATYNTGELGRRFVSSEGGDTLEISSDGRTLTFTATMGSQFVDQMRVLTRAPAPVVGEAGTVTVSQADGSEWHTVTLNRSYTDPVVIMGPPTFNGPDPTTIRVRNAGPNSFEFQMDEWDYLDAFHGTETLSYMVVEAGTYTLAGGMRLQAGRTTAHVDWQGVSLDGFGGAPVVMSQVASFNGGSAVTTRHQALSAGGFEVKVQEQEDLWRGGSGHALEDIHWIAIESGGGSGVEVGATSHQVDQNWSAISFADSHDDPPVFLADMQELAGEDPATLRYQGLTGAGVEVRVQEEESWDGELGHAAESVGYLVLSDGHPNFVIVP